jgi:large subunit ribosomal protein L24
MTKTHVNTGDIVKVIAGNHRGAQGKIIRVIREKDQVFIEGVRMIKKHLGRSQDRPQGEIIEKEGPIHISNVKLIELVAAKSSSKKSPKKEIAETAETPKKKAQAKKASASNKEE